MRPVILVPGVGGAALVHKNQQNRKVFGKYILDNRWVNLGMLSTSQYYQRWKQDMAELAYTKDSNDNFNGMKYTDKITVCDFGGTRGVRDLLPELEALPEVYNRGLDRMFSHRYFGPLCDSLIEKGYKDKVDLYGAPYDFRLSLDPRYRNTYFSRIKRLIELACARAGEPVVLVSHSFGGVMLTWFMDSMSPEWIAQHIHHWIPVSTPFAGSTASLLCLVQGSHYISMLKNVVTDDLQHVSSIVACLPSLPLPVLKFKDGKELFPSDYKNEENQSRIPALKVYCDLMPAFSRRLLRVPTTVVYNVTKNTPHYCDLKNDKIYRMLGDGMVTVDSLSAHTRFIDSNNTNEIKIDNHNHTNVIMSKELQNIIRRV